jgi:peptide-methionine (R)-S-oxide reductase
MKRRTFLISLIGVGSSVVITYNLFGRDQVVSAGKITKINKSDAEWREILTPEQFGILREEDTEPPFSSPLNKETGEGTYVCAGCALPLFTSQMKYNSGTGWPSFYTSIEGHLETKTDFKLILPRTEYHCARCNGHQGHVFDDGPEPTRQRWCNNGLALQFMPEQSS